MASIRLSLFLLGIVLAILGWFFDKASEFKWLLKMTSPDYVDGTNALDLLASNSRLALTTKHPGLRVLIDHWPELSDKTRVASISRTVAFMEFGPQVRNDIELIARDAKDNEIPKRWRYTAARELLMKERDSRLFWAGALIFFSGLAIACVTGLLEFVYK